MLARPVYKKDYVKVYTSHPLGQHGDSSNTKSQNEWGETTHNPLYYSTMVRMTRLELGTSSLLGQKEYLHLLSALIARHFEKLM